MKDLKKVNLLLTVMGFTAFFVGSILQFINMDAETETIIVGLNELTYSGTILLNLSIIIWLTILNYSFFLDWRWLKTKTKADDVAEVTVFVLLTLILLSLTIFVLYDLIIWCNWYTVNNCCEPLLSLVWGSLKNLERNMIFWYIFIALVSLHSGFVIFCHKDETQKIEKVI